MVLFQLVCPGLRKAFLNSRNTNRRMVKDVNGEVWSGPRPIVCLHDEIIDAIVYAELEYGSCAEGNSELDDPLCLQDSLKEIITSLLDIRRGLVVLLQGIPDSEWDNWDRA